LAWQLTKIVAGFDRAKIKMLKNNKSSKHKQRFYVDLHLMYREMNLKPLKLNIMMQQKISKYAKRVAILLIMAGFFSCAKQYTFVETEEIVEECENIEPEDLLESAYSGAYSVTYFSSWTYSGSGEITIELKKGKYNYKDDPFDGLFSINL